jgi:hypothetical protein
MQGNPTLVEVLSYMPKAVGSDKLLLDNQNTRDLEKAIAKSHTDNLKYAKMIAFLFRGDSEYDTCKNIWNFLKKYVPYSVEPVTKQCTKTLPRMLEDARNGIGSDCKMYSVFSGTLLQTLGIPFNYRLTGYSVNYPQHIYCVTDKYIIDAVLNYFNYEKKPYKFKKDMALYNLSGFPENDEIGRIKFPNRQQIKDKLKGLAQNAVKGAKVVGAAIPRNAFLLLVTFNARALASKLAKLDAQNPAKLVDIWVNKFGGNIDNLRASIRTGATKKPFLGGKVSGIDAIGFDPATITTAIATATPIIVAIKKALQDIGVKSEEVAEGELQMPPTGTGYDKSPEGENTPEREYTPTEKEKVVAALVNKASGESAPQSAQAPESGTPPPADAPTEEKKKSMNTMLLVGAGVVGLYLLTRKKGR